MISVVDTALGVALLSFELERWSAPRSQKISWASGQSPHMSLEAVQGPELRKPQHPLTQINGEMFEILQQSELSHILLTN